MACLSAYEFLAQCGSRGRLAGLEARRTAERIARNRAYSLRGEAGAPAARLSEAYFRTTPLHETQARHIAVWVRRRGTSWYPPPAAPGIPFRRPAPDPATRARQRLAAGF